MNEQFTGDLAYETTAFVEQFWRVVGNEGFNKSIYFVEDKLKEAGYALESEAKPEDRFTYRIEKRPLERPTWESVNASVTIIGDTKTLLKHDTNRNMIALNSFSTPAEGITAEVVYIDNPRNISKVDVEGKIVFVESSPGRVFNSAVVEGGALGILSYSNPDYLKPDINVTSIQFRSIPYNEEVKGWGIALSYEAKEALKKALDAGKVEVKVNIETKIYESEELTIVADIKGSKIPEERLVFSAHVQEPGANDNASGVGVALEMAKLSAELIKNETFDIDRTLTFLWGDEIISTKRYVEEDSLRAKNIKWGISLDMVGENTELTGGSFLIEKMPDPSAIWTRGNDKHTEWGGSKMSLDDMTPHYLNDFLIGKFKAQGARAKWEVNVNPFEGGSDHVPFLRNGIPSVLFWHFTDQFYHTDNDRIDKVSQTTLKNVGTAGLASAFSLLNADENTAKTVILNIEKVAKERLDEELKQGQIALTNGEALSLQIEILQTWENWYIDALKTTEDMVENPETLSDAIQNSETVIKTHTKELIETLKSR
ncbi:M28 family peptidase [Winogradskyella maritima]|uniref:Carboxypeptidase Q n=1 Tax=Winogradskyella maritima TaxID=1517766 RepID=A0ABV8AI67_9FLAO